MGQWRASHACNRFDESQGFEDIDLARFQHFQERYVNQLQSLKVEANIYQNVDERVNDLKELCSWTNNEVNETRWDNLIGFRWNFAQIFIALSFLHNVKVRFMRDAIKVLHVSRRTLTYTFVFAYFLKKNNEVEIFEENQSDVERAVERLSGHLEQEITTENAVDLKKKIQETFK